MIVMIIKMMAANIYGQLDAREDIKHDLMLM